jgi:hypothetical protein
LQLPDSAQKLTANFANWGWNIPLTASSPVKSDFTAGFVTFFEKIRAKFASNARNSRLLFPNYQETKTKRAEKFLCSFSLISYL